MPQANSTTSRPRCTSPRASERTLPCSSVISSASWSTWLLTSSRNAKSTLERLLRDACDQSWNASRPLRTASVTSWVLPSTTCLVCSPVAGFQIGAVRVDVPAVELPLIQCSDLKAAADGIRHILGTAKHHLSGLFAGGRVPDRCGAGRRSGGGAAIDPVFKGSHGSVLASGLRRRNAARGDSASC